MQRMGLNAPDFRTYLDTLSTGYEKRIITRVLTRSRALVDDLAPMVLDGQVTADTAQTPSRSLQMTLVDVNRTVGFEADGLGDLPLHQRRLIQVGYSVRVEPLQRWCTAWIHTGPIKTLNRKGSEVSITSYGMESIALGTAWVHRSFKKGAKKTDVIRGLLAMVGLTRVSIPDLGPRIPKALHVKRLDKIWELADHIASSMDMQLFVPGTGIPTLRRIPKRPVITIDGGSPDGLTDGIPMLLTEPEIARPSDFNNIWEVLGRKPRGEKKRVGAVVSLPKSHPLSPNNPQMMTNGKPFYAGVQIINDSIRSDKEAHAKAIRLRDDQAKTVNEFSCDIMPLPVLDELDMARFRTTQEVWVARAKTLAIPVDTDEGQPAQFGSRRRTTRARKTARIGRA